VLLWNAAVMPGRGPTPSSETEPDGMGAPPLTLRWLMGPRSLPLFVVAAGMGLASAAYWTFSRELVVQSGGLSRAGSALFWVVIGVSGLAGGAAGDLIGRFGLAKALRASLVAMALAVGLLAAAPVAAYLSAAVFGAAYIMLTGIILVWSVTVYRERPSAGLGAAFLLIAVGQVIGSPAAGALAGAAGLAITFWVFAGIALATALIRPRPEDANATGNV
jgi:predicted MFS family arabinose efflux permease